MLRNRSHRGMISGSAVADSAEGRGAPTGTPKGGGLYKESMSVQRMSGVKVVNCRLAQTRYMVGIAHDCAC